MTRIAVIGAGNIAGNIAGLLARAGHDVLVSFSTDPTRLAALAGDIGAASGTPAEAAAHGEVIVLSVPWAVIDTAHEQAGAPQALAGKIVIDTTNQFGRVNGHFGVPHLGGRSGAEINAAKAPDATWVKAFNTRTAGFQASTAGRTGTDRVVMFYATDTDTDAVVWTVESLINDAGFDAVRTGTFARTDVGHQEAKGELYGEQFHRDDAHRHRPAPRHRPRRHRPTVTEPRAPCRQPDASSRT